MSLIEAIAALKNVAQLPPGTTINIGERDVIYVDDFPGTDAEKFKAAFDLSNTNGAREIRLSAKVYSFDTTLQVNTVTPIKGVRHKTVLNFTNTEVPGLHLPCRLEGESIYVNYVQSIEDIIIKGGQAPYQPTNENHVGLLINSEVTLSRVTVRNFLGDAFRIQASLPNNASNAKLYDCNAIECSGRALFIKGADANSIITTNFDARDCKEGIIDECFLGNLHVKPMLHNCGSSITCVSANQENLILNPYVEEDTPAMKITGRNMSIGGQTRAERNSNHLRAYNSGFFFSNNISVGESGENHTTMNHLGIEFGKRNADARGMEIFWDKEKLELQIRDRWTKEVKQTYKAA